MANKGAHSIGAAHNMIFGPLVSPIVPAPISSQTSQPNSSGGAGVGVNLLLAQ